MDTPFHFVRDIEKERAMLARMGPNVIGLEATPEEHVLLDVLLSGSLDALGELVVKHLSAGETIRIEIGFLAMWLGNVVGAMADRFLMHADAAAADLAYRTIELNVSAGLRPRAAAHVAKGGER